MVITNKDKENVLQVVKKNEGKHSDRVLKEIMKKFGCGSIRAGNLLHYCVINGFLELDGFKIYLGEDDV